MPSRTIALFKPYDVLSQFRDAEGRTTLKAFVPIPGVYPVGRLDRDSEGLLLLTDDGVLAHRLTDPRFEHPKTYLVQVERVPDDRALEALRRGLVLSDGPTRPAEVELLAEPPELPERSVPIRFRKNVPTALAEDDDPRGAQPAGPAHDRRRRSSHLAAGPRRHRYHLARRPRPRPVARADRRGTHGPAIASDRRIAAPHPLAASTQPVQSEAAAIVSGSNAVSPLRFVSTFRIDWSTLEGIRSACSGRRRSGTRVSGPDIVSGGSIRGGRKGTAMASPAQVEKMITLEEFLRMPEIDERPYLEYIDGRIEAKLSPQKKHGLLEKHLMIHIDAYSKPRNLGETFPELRCTFAGRSMIPDVVFLLEEHIETDEDNVVLDPTPWPPDIHIEIVSPDQSAQKCHEKLVFSRSNGCPLGWLIDPVRLTVYVYRPGRRPKRLPDTGVLEGDPVLPGYRLPIAELFEWRKVRKSKPSPGDLR